MIDKKYFILFFLSLLVISACAQPKDIEPKSYIAYQVTDAITIDGVANEEVWKKAPWTTNFIDIEGVKTPKYQTRVKMLWNETYFYIYAELEEPHVWADITKRDAVIFHNNDFEVFVDPDGDTHNYYELEINALNTVWDLFIDKPYREQNQPVLNDWDMNGLKSAVKVNGTLNNPNDKDKGWTVELAIPWTVYKTSYYQDNVPRDQFWRVNFSRVNWDYELVNGKYQRKKGTDGKFLHEYNWVWSPQGVINMHEPEKWAYVFFSTKSVQEKDNFSIPDDERIKWELYKLYRGQKAYYSKNKKWQTSLNGAIIKVKNKSIKPVLENHSQGYNITVESPFTGKKITIKEDGKLIIK